MAGCATSARAKRCSPHFVQAGATVAERRDNDNAVRPHLKPGRLTTAQIAFDTPSTTKRQSQGFYF
jgi:hypothetical protein